MGIFEECVELNAIFAIEAAAARLTLQACGLLRWELDVVFGVR